MFFLEGPLYQVLILGVVNDSQYVLHIGDTDLKKSFFQVSQTFFFQWLGESISRHMFHGS